MQKSQSLCAVHHAKINIEAMYLNKFSAVSVNFTAIGLLNKKQAWQIMRSFGDCEVHQEIFFGLLV